VASYYKAFPSAGIDFLLNTEGMGKDMMAPSATYFVKHRSVAAGSYVYDDPSKADDEHLIRFGEVPPFVYSEAISEIGRITEIFTQDSRE